MANYFCHHATTLRTFSTDMALVPVYDWFLALSRLNSPQKHSTTNHQHRQRREIINVWQIQPTESLCQILHPWKSPQILRVTMHNDRLSNLTKCGLISKDSNAKLVVKLHWHHTDKKMMYNDTVVARSLSKRFNLTWTLWHRGSCSG